MASGTSPTDQRPFTAIIIRHAQLASLVDLPRLVGARETSPTAEFQAGAWTVWRWEYLHKRNLYPKTQAGLADRERDGAWAHDLYVAKRDVDGVPYIALASPYVRLLRQLNDDLRLALSEITALRYATLDMAMVFSEFQSGKTDMTATRVTLEILDELEDLELISLTGKNPLNSKLHSQVRAVAAPYAIRVEIAEGDQKARVSIDRVGNLWWYQTSESKTRLIFQALDNVIAMGAMNEGLRFPLDLRYSRDQPQEPSVIMEDVD